MATGDVSSVRWRGSAFFTQSTSAGVARPAAKCYLVLRDGTVRRNGDAHGGRENRRVSLPDRARGRTMHDLAW